MTRDFSTILDDHEGPSPQTDSGGFNLDIKRMLVLRAPIIITVALVLAVPAMLAAWFLTPVVYTATGLIRFNMSTTLLLGEQERTGGNSREYSSFVDTEIRQIEGPKYIEVVLKDLRGADGTLRHPADRSLKLKSFEGIINPTDQLSTLMGAISARRQGQSELAAVSCTLPDRAEAIAVLTKILNTYILVVRAEEKASLPTGQLEEMKSGLTKEWREASDKVDEQQGLLAAHYVPPVPERSVEAEAIQAKILETDEAIQALEGQRKNQESKIERLAELMTEVEEGSTATFVEYSINERVNVSPMVLDAQALVTSAQVELARIQETDKASQRLEKAKDRVASMKSNLVQVRRDVTKETLEQMLASANEDLERLTNQKADTEALRAQFEGEMDSLDAQHKRNLSDYRTKLGDESKLMFELEQLQRVETEKREKLKRVEDRLEEILNNNSGVGSQAIEQASGVIAPNSQDYKRKLMYIVAALLVSVGTGLAVGLTLELLDQNFRSAKDFTRVSQLPVVGTIPDALEDPALDGAEHALLTGQYAGSRTADEFRRILSRVLYPEENSAEVNTLLIVSPSRGDGKTSVACNLAIALGNSNRRVLLVDINAQRPDIERIFGLERGPGLTEVLDGVYEREKVIRPVAYGNLHVIGPGLDSLRLSSRLASREMTDFLEWADDNFDHVVMDTPAILLVSDAKLLASTVDAVMVVVGSGTTTFGMARRCLSDLEHLHADVIGLILNRARRLRGGYMRKNLELYYDYTSRDSDSGAEDLPEMEILETPQDFEDAVVLLPAGVVEEEDDRQA